MAASNKVREQLAQHFLEALNQGRIPWEACWSQSRPLNPVTGKVYRGVNAIALSYTADHRGYTDPRWCTYRQAQEKGWQVRKGEKSASVEYWAYYDTKARKLLPWEDVKQKLKADPDYEKYLQLRCRTYSVFNAQQIDGIPALEQNHTDIGVLRQQRDTLIRNMGVRYEEYGSSAFYRPSQDTVVLPPEASFHDTYSYMATLLHECGHATGHPDRLDRDMSGIFGSESYAREELRAEIASAFTAQSLGLQLSEGQMQYHLDQHTAYIQSWAKVLQKNPEELFRAIKAAEGISDYLIEKGEFEVALTTEPKEWHIVYRSDDPMDGEREIVPVEALQDRESLARYYCSSPQEAAAKLERYEELDRCFWEETNDPETQEWREELTADEAAMVAQWDAQVAHGMSQLTREILDREAGGEQSHIPIENTDISHDALAQEASKPQEAKFTIEEIPGSPNSLRLHFHDGSKIPGYPSVESRPWQRQIASIREVVIDSGITEIGRNCLCDYPALERVVWPETIPKSDPFGLRNCPALKEIVFSGELQHRWAVRDLASLSELLDASIRYPSLKRGQLEEVAGGFRDGLTTEQIDVYAKPEFTAIQMNSIRYSFGAGLTAEQIAFQANPAFDAIQMDIIRAGFQAGMTMDQVQFFAQPELSANQMLDAYRAIQDGRSLEPPAEVQQGDAAEYAQEPAAPELMTVVCVEPNKQARIEELPHTLKAMQATVGGSIEATYPFEDPVAIICNEEGKMVGLPPNRGLYDHSGQLQDIICGTFFVAGCGAEDFCSLSPELAQKYLEQFKRPEQFLYLNNKIIGLKTEPENMGQALSELMTKLDASNGPAPTTPILEGPTLTMGG